MKQSLFVCFVLTFVVILRSDGDQFVNNFQAPPVSEKSEMNFSWKMYPAAFQGGMNNTNADYQTAPASTYLDPNASSDSGLNNGELAGVVTGSVVAAGVIGAGVAYGVKKWRNRAKKMGAASVKLKKIKKVKDAFDAVDVPVAETTSRLRGNADSYAVVDHGDVEILVSETPRPDSSAAAPAKKSDTGRGATSVVHGSLRALDGSPSERVSARPSIVPALQLKTVGFSSPLGSARTPPPSPKRLSSRSVVSGHGRESAQRSPRLSGG